MVTTRLKKVFVLIVLLGQNHVTKSYVPVIAAATVDKLHC